MGEYEDRYPDAYGRDADLSQPAAPEEREQVIQPRQARDLPGLRSRLGLGAAAETAPSTGWQHTPRDPTAGPAADPVMVEPKSPAAPMPVPTARGFRGIGPRGYIRSDQRIYEDICDRLTENPFIDPSDIEVRVDRGEVMLTGTVDSATELRQIEAICEEIVGVRHLHSRLALRSGAAGAPSAGDRVNRAMPPPPLR